MNGVTAAMLVMLGLSAPLHTPDLQVEAVTASGAELPELAEAVARALVAGGARVVLVGPTSRPCEYCGKVRVTETGPGLCRVEVRHEQHVASTTMHLPAGSSLFDRARAIAIQAHLLMPWQAVAASKGKEVTARPTRKVEAPATSAAAQVSAPPSATTRAESSRSLASRIAPGPVPPPIPVRVAAPAPAVVEGPAPPALPTVVYTSRTDSKPVSRPGEAKPLARPEAKPVSRATPAEVGQSESKPESPIEAAAEQPRGEAGGLPSAELVAARAAKPKRRWPWIPTAIGAGAAVAAGVCAVVARGHYNALSDTTQPYGSAQAHKSAGENWQTASLVLSGVAVVGVGTGIIGFSARSSGGSSVTTMASPVPGGGVIAIAGDFP